MKKCFKCLTLKPLSEFYKHSGMKDGHLNKCKSCAKVDVKQNRDEKSEYYKSYDRARYTPEKVRENTAKYREKYRSDESFRESVKVSADRWKRKNPQKRSAQVYLGNAVRDGRIVKKTLCEHCESSVKVQAHHWSYEREHWLDVIWLCPPCHGAEHRRLNDLGRDPDAQH